jgi:superfamily II DNA or RNA helicase
MTPLFSIQKTHVAKLQKILDTHSAVLDSSDCGTGKTYVGAELARLHKGPVLVVAPLATLPFWRAIMKDRGVPAGFINYEKLRTGRTEFVKKEPMLWKWQLSNSAMIIFDEAHRLKSRDSIISKIAIAAKPYKNIFLSATIAENPLHLRAVGFLLGLHNLKNYWNWCRILKCAPNGWGGLEFTGGQKELQKLHAQIYPEHGDRISLTDMADLFPENRIVYQKIDFGDKGKIQALYEEMEAELTALKETAEQDSKGAEALTIQLRQRQKTELLKVPMLAERAQDLVEEGMSVVIFCCFRDTIRALQQRLPNAPAIEGGQKPEERERIKQDFQSDKTPILLCNVAAGGAGISLHGTKPRATLITLSWTAPDIKQALGRTHRAKGSSSIQYILTCSDSVEEQLEVAVRQKLANIETLNVGN